MVIDSRQQQVLLAAQHAASTEARENVVQPTRGPREVVLDVTRGRHDHERGHRGGGRAPGDDHQRVGARGAATA